MNGIKDGFSRMATQLRHIFFGVTPNEQKQYDETKQKADQAAANNPGGVIDPTGITGLGGTIANDLEWLIIVLVGLLAYVFIFKK